MNYYSQLYLARNPRLVGKSDLYLHFHELLDCHISVLKLLFSRERELDKLAGHMEFAHTLSGKNIRPLNMEERRFILNDNQSYGSKL